MQRKSRSLRPLWSATLAAHWRAGCSFFGSVVPWTSAATVTASGCCNYGQRSVRSCFVFGRPCNALDVCEVVFVLTSQSLSLFVLSLEYCTFVDACSAFDGPSSYESSVGSCFVPAYPAIGGLCPRTMLAFGTSVRMVVYLLTMRSGSCLYGRVSAYHAIKFLSFCRFLFLSFGELKRSLSIVKIFDAACSLLSTSALFRRARCGSF